MKHVITIAALALVLIGSSVHAQDKMAVLTYDMSVPLGDTQDYVGEPSFRGIGFAARRFISPYTPIALGTYFGWHVFDEHTSETIELPNGAVTGPQRRYLNVFPIMVSAHYYFGDESKGQLFVGGNVGTYYALRRFEIGVGLWEEGEWLFGLAPEVGVQLPLGDAELVIATKFNYGMAGGQDLANKDIAMTYWGISVGFASRSW